MEKHTEAEVSQLVNEYERCSKKGLFLFLIIAIAAQRSLRLVFWKGLIGFKQLGNQDKKTVDVASKYLISVTVLAR